MKRDKVTYHRIECEVVAFTKALNEQIKKKGMGGLVSPHEMLGVVTEEYHELVEAVRCDDIDRVREELTDVMIAAFWSLASITLDQVVSRNVKREIKK